MSAVAFVMAIDSILSNLAVDGLKALCCCRRIHVGLELERLGCAGYEGRFILDK
jgi:hypothetical protein